MKLKSAALAASFLFAPAVLAQTTTASVPAAQAAPAPTVTMGATSTAVLRVGTPVVLRTLTGLTTKGKTLRVGDRVNMEVGEAVVINGVTVIPAGSPAVGELTNVRNKGMWGKSGLLQGRVLSLNANGRTIRLSGAFDDKGVTGTAGVVGAVALLPLAGFFTTGTSAQIPAGSVIKAFLDEDVPVTITGAAAPTAMTVPAGN